jgi:PHP family Zn ribbon phosphoesterase
MPKHNIKTGRDLFTDVRLVWQLLVTRSQNNIEVLIPDKLEAVLNISDHNRRTLSMAKLRG